MIGASKRAASMRSSKSALGSFINQYAASASGFNGRPEWSTGLIRVRFGMAPVGIFGRDGVAFRFLRFAISVSRPWGCQSCLLAVGQASFQRLQNASGGLGLQI